MTASRIARRAALAACSTLAIAAPMAGAAMVQFDAPATQSGSFPQNATNAIALAQSNQGSSPLDLLISAGTFGGGIVESRVSTIAGDWRMGPPSNTSIQDISLGGTPNNFVTGDASGDGNIDIAAATDAGVRISRGAANGNYGAFNTPSGSVSEVIAGVALAPLDANGSLDMIAAGPGSLDVYLNSGSSTTPFATRTQNALNNSNPTDLAMADFDGDGDFDAATTSLTDQRAVVVPKTGVADFTSFVYARSVGLFTRPGAVTAADVTGDGRSEMIVAEPDRDDIAIISTGLMPSTLGPIKRIDTGAAPLDVETADLDGDGLREIVTADAASDTITVIGLDGATKSFPAGPTPVGVAIGDVTGDGLKDVVTLSDSIGGVTVLRNLGVPVVPPPVPEPVPPIAPIRTAKLKCAAKRSRGLFRQVVCSVTLSNPADAKSLSASLVIGGRNAAKAKAAPGKKLTFTATRGFKAGKHEVRLVVTNLDATVVNAKQSVTVKKP